MHFQFPGYLKRPIARYIKKKLFQTTKTPEYVFAHNKNGVYCFPSSHQHRPSALALMCGDVWEAETAEFITEHCKGGDIIMAGVWAGESLPVLSRAALPHGVVWGFEPNPETFRCAAVTALLNDLSNVKLTNAGLGDKSKATRLVIRDADGVVLGGASHVINSGQDEANSVPIEIVAIDDVVPETATPTIIQLDVEGYEELALLGASKTIKRCKPFLILETLPTPGSAADDLLNSLGYRRVRPLDAENTLLSVAPA